MILKQRHITMSSFSPNNPKLVRKCKTTGIISSMPMCAVCERPATPMHKWQIKAGLPETHLYSVWRPLSIKHSEMTGIAQGSPCCEGCKRKLNAQWRQTNPDVYINSTDHYKHTELNEFLGTELTIAEFNSVMSKSKTGAKVANDIRDMIDRGIDFRVFNSVSEHTYYTRYTNYYPDTTIEEFREIRVNGIDYAEFVERENLRIVAFMQQGSENNFVDALSGSPFHVTDYNRAGNENFRALIDNLQITERPDHHHFVIRRNISITKNDKSEPSQLMRTDILGNPEAFIEMMGTIAVGKTSHKLLHSDQLGGDADIRTLLEYGIAPWWARSEENYRQLQGKYPGMIDDISYEQMIDRHTLEHYVDGTYPMSRKGQSVFGNPLVIPIQKES